MADSSTGNPLDTVYCEECRKDVTVERLPDQSVVIHCPHCTGECMACDCHLARTCFDGVPVRVIHPEQEERP